MKSVCNNRAAPRRRSFNPEELPTLKDPLPALDEGSLSWLRAMIEASQVRADVKDPVAAWVTGLERGFQAVSREVQSGVSMRISTWMAKPRNKGGKKHVVVWALRDVDADGDSLEPMTPTTQVLFDIDDQTLLSESWTSRQYWRSTDSVSPGS